MSTTTLRTAHRTAPTVPQVVGDPRDAGAYALDVTVRGNMYADTVTLTLDASTASAVIDAVRRAASTSAELARRARSRGMGDGAWQAARSLRLATVAETYDAALYPDAVPYHGID